VNPIVAPVSVGVFNGADWLVVGLFVLVMLAIVLYSMRTQVRSGQD